MKTLRLINTFAIPFLAGLLSNCVSNDEPGFNGFVNNPGNIVTIAGLGPENFGSEGDGKVANKAKVGWVTGIDVDNEGNIFITDGAANTVRKIDITNGHINTMAGSFRGFNVIDPTPFAGDGGKAGDAHLNVPLTALIDPSGRVYVADAGNNVIRKIESDVISTFAGVGGTLGFSGDGSQASAAKLYNPNGLATDYDGNLYIADAQNHVVRKVTISTGVISTIAGSGPTNPGYSGDNGPATSAKLDTPYGLAIDKNGIIYIADQGNNVIRKITNGIITTFAGTGTEGYSGDEGPAVAATFRAVKGIAVDDDGNVFVADAGNNVVRRIATNGSITTYAGNGSAGYSGDGGPASQSQLNSPWGIAVDDKGNLYIADTYNSAVRLVSK